MEAQDAIAAEYEDEARLGQRNNDGLGRVLLGRNRQDTDDRKPLLSPTGNSQDNGPPSYSERDQPWNVTERDGNLPWHKRPSVF